MNVEEGIFLAICAAALILITTVLIVRRELAHRRNKSRIDDLREAGVDVPSTLHPVFDATRCIGSLSCASACPQGHHVIGLVHGRGALVDPTHCIGHGRCAAECPVDAIRLVFGSAERGVDIPHLKPTFETNVEGIYITGELGGMGLVANAVRQASEGMQNIRDAIARKPRSPGASADGVVDVAIIGSGPAGLTSALSAVEMGLSYRWLEREPTVGGSVLHYPRRKIVLLDPFEFPLLGPVKARTMYKEEFLKFWERAIGEHGLKLEGGVAVENIQRTNGFFTLATGAGPVRARAVMLCAGRRGPPNKLGVPGEESGKVAYSMPEPEAHAGRRVLIVGGGDSALEAACQLVEETDAAVTLSYRRKMITRAKPENIKRFNALVAQKRVGPLWESELVEISERHVRLKTPGGIADMENDDVLVFAGGQPPAALLERAGIRMERCFGDVSAAHREAHAAHAREHGGGRLRARIFTAASTVLCLLVVGALLWLGRDFYFSPTPGDIPEAAKTYRPAGMMGQNIGALAFVFMLANLVYYIRKEFVFMKGLGEIRTWMQFHVASGLLAGAVALIHAALVLNNIFGLVLYVSLGAVVVTGIVGRFIYGLVPENTLTCPSGRENRTGLSRFKDVLGWWRVGHGVLALFLIFVIILHVGVEFWVGYRWIF